jgi:DNA repair exonuclease SbcCD nuclease subunit
MKFQYFSDIHLDYYNENLPKIQRMFIKKLEQQKDKPSILLIAGDIGLPYRPSYSTFLQSLSPLYEKIFITTGNHEYYKMPCSSLNDLDNHCREVCRTMPQDNVVFLQNDTYKIKDNVSIFGGTFWTDIPESKAYNVMHSVNDYKLIPYMTPSLSSLLHEKAVSLLNYHVNNENNENNEDNKDMKWIVMSHHMPSFDLIDRKYTNTLNTDMNYAFASEVSIANDPRILAWVYGHTHLQSEKGKFYCNPIGYPGENKHWTLFKDFTIVV